MMMMASSTNGQKEEERYSLSTFSLAKSCPIHFGPLKNAKQLPCDHIFCFDCLKPLSNSNRVVCPLCNLVHNVDIYLLPLTRSNSLINRYLINALPASADEYLTKSQVTSTENALKNVESTCEMVIELLDSMKQDFRDMKSSFEQKRESLVDEMKQIDRIENEDEKSIESKNLLTICDMFQRVCAMAQDRALNKILQTSKDVEHVCQQVKSIGLCRYFVDSETDLDENREKEIIDCLASFIQQNVNNNNNTKHDIKILCENLIQQFPQKLSNYSSNSKSAAAADIWTAIVGDASVIWNVPSILLVQGQTNNQKMLIYCSRENSDNNNYKLGLLSSQTRFKTIIESEWKDRKLFDQELISRISKKVDQEFGGKWHCIMGNREKFISQSTVDRNFLLKTEIDNQEFICWKY